MARRKRLKERERYARTARDHRKLDKRLQADAAPVSVRWVEPSPRKKPTKLGLTAERRSPTQPQLAYLEILVEKLPTQEERVAMRKELRGATRKDAAELITRLKGS